MDIPIAVEGEFKNPMGRDRVNGAPCFACAAKKGPVFLELLARSPQHELAGVTAWLCGLERCHSRQDARTPRSASAIYWPSGVRSPSRPAGLKTRIRIRIEKMIEVVQRASPKPSL